MSCGLLGSQVSRDVRGPGRQRRPGGPKADEARSTWGPASGASKRKVVSDATLRKAIQAAKRAGGAGAGLTSLPARTTTMAEEKGAGVQQAVFEESQSLSNSGKRLKWGPKKPSGSQEAEEPGKAATPLSASGWKRVRS